MKLREYLSSIQDKTVAVIGVGVSNTPLLELLLDAGISVTACDKRNRAAFGELADHLERRGCRLQLGEDYLDHLDQDIIFRTPGLHPKYLEEARRRGSEITSEMEVFFNQRIVPILEQYVMECNYKVFTQSARSKGNRIEWYRNPFEYLPIDKAIDVAYKGAMDTTTNERRRMIYKLPPAEGGDVLMENKNFQQTHIYLIN